jgi:hypothetical protein
MRNICNGCGPVGELFNRKTVNSNAPDRLERDTWLDFGRELVGRQGDMVEHFCRVPYVLQRWRRATPSNLVPYWFPVSRTPELISPGYHAPSDLNA